MAQVESPPRPAPAAAEGRPSPRPPLSWGWLLALVVALPAIAPLCAPGLIGTHRYGDSPFLLVRLVAILQGWARGELLPRWSPELSYGLGYPFFDFYGALAYQLAAALRVSGFPAVESLKLVQALGFLSASLFAYLLARRHLGEEGGLVAAAAYGFAPYHLVNVYARGDSLGEFVAIGLLPGLLLAVEVAAEGRVVGAAGAAVLFGALILSHNLSALLAAPVVALWAAAALAARWRLERRLPWRGLVLVAGGLGLGVGLTTYYWLPVLYDRRYIHFEHNTTGYFDFRNHFLSLQRLVQPSLVYDYGLEGTSDGGLPFQVGFAQALLAAIGIVALPLALARRRGGVVGVMALLVAAGALALATPLGRPIWELAEPLQVAQFPWRLLGPAALGLALLAALPAAALPRRPCAVWCAAAVLIAAVGGGWGATPERWRIADADVDAAHVQQYEYLTSSIGSTVRYEYLPSPVRERPWTSSRTTLGAPMGLRGLPGQTPRIETTGELSARVVAPAGGPLVFEQQVFPGLRGFVDGAEVAVAASDPEGFATLDVPAGEHAVALRFDETRLRRLARYGSLAALGLAALLFARWIWLGLRGSGRPVQEASGHPAPGYALTLPSPRGRGEAFAESEARWAAAAVAVVAVALFVARAPWGEWSGASSDATASGLNRRVGHEHAPWPYLGTADLGGARVVGYRQPAEVRSGDTATIELRVEGTAVPGRARLISPAETIVEAPREIASADVDLRQGDGLVSVALPVPIGAPPGLYQVQLGRADGQGRRWTLAPLRVLPVAPSAASTPPPGAPAAAPVALASFGGELALERIVATGDASAGRPSFELGWRALRQPRGDWRFSARLVDEAGHLWGSSDGRPADGFFPTRYWTAGVPVTERRDVAPRPGTPPGRYRLEVRVYGLDGAGLDVVDARGAAVAPFYRSEPFELGPGPAPAQPLAGALPLDLLEVRLGAERAAAGTTVPLTTLLRANAPPGRDLALSVKMGPIEQRLPLAAGFPASRWRPGEVVAAQVDPRVPFELQAGAHEVMLTIVDAAGSPVLGPLPAGRLAVENRPRRFDVPPMGRAVGARLGDAIELLGYDLTASGERANLTLYWRAARPIETSYTVFTHLLDSEGRVKGQVDAVPGGGGLPTDGWAPGEVVADRYEIPLQAGAASGRYAVEVGMYDARSGARLPVRAGGAAQSAGPDFVILGAVDLAR